MAKVTLYQDDCRRCGKSFTYQFEGIELEQCGECTVKFGVVTVRHAQSTRNGLPFKDNPIRKQSHSTRDVWLTSSEASVQSRKQTGRIGECTHPGCGVTFMYTSPGRPRTKCDEHRAIIVSSKERMSTCKLCGHEFTFKGRGRTRVVCDRELCQAVYHTKKEKATDEVKGSQRAERLLLMLADRARQRPDLYRDYYPPLVDLSVLHTSV